MRLSPRRTGLVCSLVMHVAAIAAGIYFAKWLPFEPIDAQFSGARQVVVSTASPSAAKETPPVEVSEPPQPPAEAKIEPLPMTPPELVAAMAAPKQPSGELPPVDVSASVASPPTAPAPQILQKPPVQQSKPQEQPSRTPIQRTRSTTPPSVASFVSMPVLGSDETIPPTFISNRPPEYPSLAIARRWQGTVLLKLFISSAGDVVRVEILQSSGHTVLDEAALRAVTRWRAEPARRGGYAVATVEKLPVRFRL